MISSFVSFTTVMPIPKAKLVQFCGTFYVKRYCFTWLSLVTMVIFMQLNHIELKTNWNNHRNRKVAHMKFNNGLSKWLCMKSYTYSLDVTNRRKDLVKWNMTGFWAFLFYYCINNNNETYFTFFPLFLLLVNHFTFIHFVAMIIIFFFIFKLHA